MPRATQQQISQVEQARRAIADLYRQRGLQFDERTGTAVRLPPATAPSSAANVNSGITSTAIPNLRPNVADTSLSSAARAGASEKIKAYEQQQADVADAAKAERDVLLQTQDKNRGAIAQFLSDQPDITTLRSEAFKQTGINPKQYFSDQKAKIAEIEKLSNDYDKEVARRDEELARMRENPTGALSSALDANIAQVERVYATRLNQKSANIKAKSSVLEALQGNFAEAEKFANQAVEDATADRKFKLDSITTLYQLNEDSINRLDKEYKDALSTSIGLAKDQYDREYDEKKAQGELLVSAAKAGVDLSSYMNSSLQSMQRAFASQVSATGGDDAFTTTQINKGASNAGIEMDAFKGLDSNVKNFYINLSSAQKTDLGSLFDQIDSGDLSKEDAIDEIDTWNVPESVKEYLKSRVNNEEQPTQSPSRFGQFFRSVWDAIRRGPTNVNLPQR